VGDYRTQFDEWYEKALNILQTSGSAGQTFKYINAIGDEDYRNATFEKVARLFAAQGRAEDALQFSRAIDNPVDLADSLFEVGRELRKNKSLDSAKDVFRQAINAAATIKPGAWEIAAIFLQVTEELWNLDEKTDAIELLRRAIDLAKQPPQDFEASKTLAGCARLLSSWDHREEAVEVAECVESPEQRNLVLEELGRPGGPGIE